MRLLLFVALLWLAGPALAHDGEAHSLGWTWSPLVTVPLAALAIVHAIGFARLWRRAEKGRSRLRREARLFGLGWLALAGALISPLHEGGETSFTLHMIEHEILMLVAALLLVAGRPGPALLWAFPGRARRGLSGIGRWGLWRQLGDPIVATALQALVMIVWHVPWLFDLALRDEGWHIVQHLSFIGSALLFWWAMLNSRPGRAGWLVSALCLFVTSMIGGGLGALMAFAESPWYSGYAALGLTAFGLTPQEDQQLAGTLMWVPGGLYHLAAALWFLVRGLRESEGGSDAIASR
jgi:putative membrane protein